MHHWDTRNCPDCRGHIIRIGGSQHCILTDLVCPCRLQHHDSARNCPSTVGPASEHSGCFVALTPTLYHQISIQSNGFINTESMY